jgi:hypothetical protein
MKRFYWILGLLYLLLFVAAFASAHYRPEVVTVYQTNARTPLFSGFITLGSFLLTLKTTILQRLKDGFDSQQHEKAYLYHVENGGKQGYYESLANMSTALSLAVFFALGSSMFQMTFGFINKAWAFALCVATPIGTLLVITYLWREITLAHQGWISKIEEDKAADLKKRKLLSIDEES